MGWGVGSPPTGNEKPVSWSLASKDVPTIDTPSRLRRPIELSISLPESRLNDKWEPGGAEGERRRRTLENLLQSITAPRRPINYAQFLSTAQRRKVIALDNGHHASGGWI